MPHLRGGAWHSSGHEFQRGEASEGEGDAKDRLNVEAGHCNDGTVISSLSSCRRNVCDRQSISCNAKASSRSRGRAAAFLSAAHIVEMPEQHPHAAQNRRHNNTWGAGQRLHRRDSTCMSGVSIVMARKVDPPVWCEDADRNNIMTD